MAGAAEAYPSSIGAPPPPSALTLILIDHVLAESERLRREAEMTRPGVYTDPEYDDAGNVTGVWVVARRRAGKVVHRGFYALPEYAAAELEEVVRRQERRIARLDGRALRLLPAGP